MNQINQKHHKEISGFLQAGDFEQTEEGLLIHKGILAKGEYFESVNGQDERIHPNLIPTEGIHFILNVGLGAVAKASGFYLAPYATAITPTASWTGANFAANSGEITSATEGFVGTRPAWTPGSASAGAIDNMSAKASFAIVCTTSLNINGAGLIANDNVRGGTTGSLISASRFAATRVVYNGDTWDCGYRVTLLDS